MTEGRMGGIVDWTAIEDRVRKPSRPSYFSSPVNILNAALNEYRKDRMNGQEVYVEVWVEKDALSGVLKRVTEEFGINIMVNRGYSSVTAMYDSYQRFNQVILEGKKVKILYLGDHDPSGMDMIRDVRERIAEFLINDKGLREFFDYKFLDYRNNPTTEYYEIVDDDAMRSIQKCFDYYEGSELYVFNPYLAWIYSIYNVEPVALTTEQIREYAPPPNPAKITDPRANDYIIKYGDYSWEVDALKPQVLNQVLRDKILEVIDYDKFLEIKKEEVADKNNLNSIIKANYPDETN